MAMEVNKALNVVKNIAHHMKKAEVNLKKCPKARLTRNYIESRLKCVEDYWSEYQQAHSIIIREIAKDEGDKIPYIANDVYNEDEELYISLKADLQDLLVSQQDITPLPVHIDTKSSTRVVLPKIQLPTYGGQYEDWLSFHDLFSTLVHNNPSLNNVQKLHYLKTSVTGEAASVLKHIHVTDSNHEQAWNILKRRYGNKRININAVMKRFFSQKKITSNSSGLIKNLLDTTLECLHHLNNMQVDTNNSDPIIIFVLVQKLDAETHKDWEIDVSNKCKDADSLPTLEMLREFLECRFRTLELTETSKQRSSSYQMREKSFHIATTVENTKKCQLCNDNHTLSHCKEFAKKTPVQRSDFIKLNNMCFNCLTLGHSVRQCRNPLCCRLCKSRHHSLLHEGTEINTSIVTTVGNSESGEIKQPEVALYTNIEKPEEDVTMVASHVITKRSTALLATAIVQVRSENNFTTTLRALIDQGSQASFISERAAQQLAAKRYPIRGTVIGVGSKKESIKEAVQIKIESRCEDFCLHVQAYVMSKPLTSTIPTRTIRTTNWPHLSGIVLADPTYFKPGHIDLLLGVDVYAQIIQNEIVKGPPRSPCAHKTNLGWILFGEIEDEPQPPESVLVMHHQIVPEHFLKTLWEVEQDNRRKHTKEERQCEEFYEKTHRRDHSGRYIVRLPFRVDNPMSPYGNTKEIAMRRLVHQEERFQMKHDVKEQYDKVLEEYLSMGHMEEVPTKDLNNPCVYLPHHAVIRKDKETTKIRVVFDASSKGRNGVSLNDELMVGPKLQEDMRSIIMRWRMHKVCFSSDITKMYRMILLDPKDTDYLRVLWRGCSSHATSNEPVEVKEYRLKTVTFGTASAPYLAVKTLMKLADDEGEQYPEAAKLIREDFYVDDLVSGCDSTTKAIRISKEITTILKKGGFDLQKWASNDTELLKSFKPEEVTTRANLDIKLDGAIKALGLRWNLGEDEFQYQIHLEPTSTIITKRTILSDLQKLFDPLGWIAPAIVRAKILVQKLWLEGVSWDQQIGQELNSEWKYIRTDLENVNTIRIKRWLHTFSTERDRIALHGFCDASERAYAAVVYCRVQTREGNIETHLIAARTKVAPVKTISLPRLELSGATLLAKLLHTVSQAMRIPSHNVFAWTDSTVVLAWLFGEPNRWKPFVANRVVEILDHTGNSQWFHVSSSNNPADIASRGTSIEELQHKPLWWNGPEWLTNNHIHYTRPTTTTTDIERRKIQSYVNTTNQEEKLLKFKEYDALTELLRVIVYCKRFLKFKKDVILEQTITADELQEALDLCIRQVQEEEFTDEIQRLKQNKTVKTTSILKTLNPYIDSHNILRVGGRLRNAHVDVNLKHPIILGKKNELVPLVLADAHLRTLHGGIQLMITYLMSKYWIIGCKNLVKNHIHKCLTCARQRVISRQQIMGDLPEARVTPSRPFSRTGVDFAGPVYVLNSKGKGAKTSKAYICIFVCMAVKAIHLELVSGLTSEAFIAAFKRFVSRRGRCIEIWSDNGTNFVAANKELHDMWRDAGLEMPGIIEAQLANDGTRWHYTPPYSPNFGGLWEAGVKSVKTHLRKVLTSNLTFEEFSTVLAQIEACLNSRPLAPTSTDVDLIDDIQVLTPGHFIVGEPLITVPDRDYTTMNLNLLSRWQHTQRIVQTFWKRWQTEYLSRLNQRPKWLKRMPEFQVGDIVLLRNESMPPSKWLLARIIEKHPGPDDITRVYTVRYNGKLTRRSHSHLSPLPISNTD